MKCPSCKNKDLVRTPFYIDWMNEDREHICLCYRCPRCEDCFMTTEQRDKFKRMRKPDDEMGHYPGRYCKEVRILDEMHAL